MFCMLKVLTLNFITQLNEAGSKATVKSTPYTVYNAQDFTRSVESVVCLFTQYCDVEGMLISSITAHIKFD